MDFQSILTFLIKVDNKRSRPWRIFLSTERTFHIWKQYIIRGELKTTSPSFNYRFYNNLKIWISWFKLLVFYPIGNCWCMFSTTEGEGMRKSHAIQSKVQSSFTDGTETSYVQSGEEVCGNGMEWNRSTYLSPYMHKSQTQAWSIKIFRDRKHADARIKRKKEASAEFANVCTKTATMPFATTFDYLFFFPPLPDFEAPVLVVATASCFLVRPGCLGTNSATWSMSCFPAAHGSKLLGLHYNHK